MAGAIQFCVMEYKHILYAFTGMLMLISSTCKQESLPIQISSCISDFTEIAINEVNITLPPLCPTGRWYENEPPLNAYNYYSPVFNPNNSNQIAYIRFDTLAPYQLEGALELHTFDFCTGEISIINKDSIVSYTVDWSRKDWLIYRKWFKDIYKVKSNGQSKTKIIDTNFSLSANQIPVWNGSGSCFAWAGDEWLAYTLDGGIKCNFTIFDENGVRLDTICELCERLPATTYIDPLQINMNPRKAGNFSWSKDDTKISCSAWAYVDYADMYGLFYYDFILDELVLVENLNIQAWYGEVTDTDWTPDNRKLVWSTERSIGWKDIYSGERKIILTGHENRRYESIDLSPDGKTIAVERLNRVNVNGCTKVERAIYLVNIDGTNERRVLIPE